MTILPWFARIFTKIVVSTKYIPIFYRCRYTTMYCNLSASSLSHVIHVLVVAVNCFCRPYTSHWINSITSSYRISIRLTHLYLHIHWIAHTCNDFFFCYEYNFSRYLYKSSSRMFFLTNYIPEENKRGLSHFLK